jgi:hypothetical protein
VFDPRPNTYELDTLEIHQSSLEFLLGMFKRVSFKRLQFDFGTQLRIKVYSEVRGMTLYSVYDNNLNLYFGTSIYDQTEPGGISVGISPLIQASYKLRRNFALGFKFSSFISYYKTGGFIVTYQTKRYPSGLIESGYSATSRQYYEGVRFFPACATMAIYYSFF